MSELSDEVVSQVSFPVFSSGSNDFSVNRSEGWGPSSESAYDSPVLSSELNHQSASLGSSSFSLDDLVGIVPFARSSVAVRPQDTDPNLVPAFTAQVKVFVFHSISYAL